MFADCDDLYFPHAFSVLHKAAEASSADFSVGNIAVMDADLRTVLGLPTYMAAMQIARREVGPPMAMPALWIPYHHQRFMLRRDFLETFDISYPNLLRGEDPPMLARVLCKARLAAAVPELVYGYRIHGRYRVNTDKKLDDFLSHVEIVVKTFREIGCCRQAAMYVYFTALEFVGIAFYKRFTVAQRRRILNAYQNYFNLVNVSLEFSPYAIDSVTIRRKFVLLQKGLFFYGFSEIFDKLSRLHFI
jgi:hypothetical protein